ncbi:MULTISPECIES: DUF4911 domain-containing protein [unclassified Dehalobacter]|jgi:hypothetical protein|uniref:DUF4911 domain-containing protein n=1 Tax=unclassified Dehalobacter TaxID=2635733 RepID=UPI00028BA41F|nr:MULTISPECIES: DUF4911 domain-containing protein [unclassified Dehalobacter]AFV01439.1 hypothetical protein DHBDCA_p411 [Dehalobacter sp. DCA]AFV04476.1 hypothetical protein DCF50_p470 [Dehalobacter sp. CF]EQB20562.1 hypothetical protein UNSWDHB_2111 [Dehalobacter sp. UNSWDHB]MDJ0304968.1 DUF4911 domain-containing protein [Dehalobacter sp.]
MKKDENMEDENLKAKSIAEDSHISWEDSDLLVKARILRSDIQLLAKYVEGLGHLGVITTTDKVNGEVMIQTTRHCWPELEKVLSTLPLQIEILSQLGFEISLNSN